MHTAIEHLVWAHTEGPEEARGAAMAYVVQRIKDIQVADSLKCAAHSHVIVSSGVFSSSSPCRLIAWQYHHGE